MKQPGRKDPTDPKLRDAKLVLQVGLRKSWTTQASYWVELYVRDLRRGGRAKMYYVYRQWSFLRRADNEVVEGGYLGGSETPSVAQAEMQIVEYVKRRIEEKDDVVAYVRNKWEDVSDPYYQALTERVTAELSPRNMSKAAYRTTSKSKEPSLADKFKQAQQERLKKAKW